ncbi:hypothetical protein niasHT_029857 [Heterodera trifolii]|uniref:Uncharacterized protein n=1 Tax=Heterodera trifolii TaxID=157864 RepID=A0ABD2K5G0_9BILA
MQFLHDLPEMRHLQTRPHISPTQPDQVKWADTLTKLKDLFAETRSLFVRRFECFQIRQKPSQDITSLVAHINAACENADLSLTKEQLKCIILVIALRDEHGRVSGKKKWFLRVVMDQNLGRCQNHFYSIECLLLALCP